MAAPSTTAVEKTEITDTKVEDVNTLSHDVEDDEEDFVFTFGKFLAVFVRICIRLSIQRCTIQCQY
jgi:hypothetical protein